MPVLPARPCPAPPPPGCRARRCARPPPRATRQRATGLASSPSPTPPRQSEPRTLPSPTPFRASHSRRNATESRATQVIAPGSSVIARYRISAGSDSSHREIHATVWFHALFQALNGASAHTAEPPSPGRFPSVSALSIRLRTPTVPARRANRIRRGGPARPATVMLCRATLQGPVRADARPGLSPSAPGHFAAVPTRLSGSLDHDRAGRYGLANAVWRDTPGANGRRDGEGTGTVTVACRPAPPARCTPAPERRRNTRTCFSNRPPFPRRERPAACSSHVQDGATARASNHTPLRRVSLPSDGVILQRIPVPRRYPRPWTVPHPEHPQGSAARGAAPGAPPTAHRAAPWRRAVAMRFRQQTASRPRPWHR